LVLVQLRLSEPEMAVLLLWQVVSRLILAEESGQVGLFRVVAEVLFLRPVKVVANFPVTVERRLVGIWWYSAQHCYIRFPVTIIVVSGFESLKKLNG
jgi:hypothetical protein